VLLTTIVVPVNNMRGGLWDGGLHGRDIFGACGRSNKSGIMGKTGSMSHGRITL
jgi:hypothetical protein